MATKPPTAKAKEAVSKLEAAAKIGPEMLQKRALERRAIESMIWGMPAVNYDLMFQAFVGTAKGKANQVAYWSRLLDWKNQTLTPNPDVIYLMPMFDTKEAGPIVLEIPPAVEGSITGSVDDGWQTAIEDVGPAGVDKGKGGKYLVLPPGHKDKTPEGYIALPSPTYRSYALLRSNLASGSDADVAQAVAYGRRVKVYPLSQATEPPATVFIDASDVVFDSTIPYDLRFFEALDRFVQREPWIERDKAMIDTLKTIGIEKGKPFKPSMEATGILNDAAAEAHALLDLEYEAIFTPPYFKGTRWALPASQEVIEALQSNYANPNSYPVDSRGASYSMGFFSAKHLGTGQFYLMSTKDKFGAALSGASTYRLSVPAKPPVNLYWSATAYDRATHALIRDQTHASRGSNTPGLVKNENGSVDVYFGPEAPAGNETNWIPTNADGAFEALFRFYGPEKALFDKTWVLPDIEKLT